MVIKLRAIGLALVLTAVGAGCATDDTSSEVGSSGDVTTSPQREDDGSNVASGATEVVVPDLDGLNLQRAQDVLQGLLLRITSNDYSGQDRSQLNDSNWYVVSQSPAGGSKVAVGADIVVDVLKIGEEP